MDDWENSDEKSLPVKEALYNHINLKDIIVADYAHVKRVCKDFELKDLGEYCDLYVQRFDSYYDLYCWLMYLRTLEICVLKYMNSIPLVFFHLLD